MKITGRSSSITNAFINSIIPVVNPTSEQVKRAFEVLELEVNDVRCVYCGDPFTEWDHLNPIVKDRQPTGYVSEIANLVPACGKCNQSKGNKNWRVWMLSAANRSPTARIVADLDKKIARIEAYEREFRTSCYDFKSMVGEQLWSQHWDNWRDILSLMTKAQVIADQIKSEIKIANTAAE